MKAILLFYLELSLVNVPFSLLMGWLAGDQFLKGFSLSFLTGGMLLAVYFFETNQQAKYFFYFNKGLSKPVLWLAVIVLNALLIFTLYTAFHGN